MAAMSAVDCDLLIVGSGFAGSVCALRAVQAGLRVVVLERGRRMTPELFEDLARGQAAVFHRRHSPGLIELHQRRGLISVTASAVGGGSHLYTGVTIPAPPEIFDSWWPEGLNSTELAPYYKRAAELIRPTPTPTTLPRTKALETIARSMDAVLTRLPLAFDWPDDREAMTKNPLTQDPRRELASWLRGGRTSRKRTMDRTYLRQAEELGADVRPLHEVTALVPDGNCYRAGFRRYERGCWMKSSLSARRVVLAAGTLNTVRMLLTWRDVSRTLPKLSRMLGERFFTNGDFGALLVAPDMELAPDAGPPVTAWIDCWKEDRMYLMETGLLPWGLGLGVVSKRLNRAWSIGVMGYDDNPGRLRLSRRGQLIHSYDPARGASFHRRRMRRLRRMAEASRSILLATPTFLAKRMPVTIHPMGGAVMADSADRGVANSFGEVFGHPGLFVADASLFPTPTGVAPSLTIAAVAERVIEHLIQHY